MPESKKEKERDEKRMDEVLKRMLNTPPEPHKPPSKSKAKKQKKPAK